MRTKASGHPSWPGVNDSTEGRIHWRRPTATLRFSLATLRRTIHSVYNDVGSVKTYFSGHLPGSVFSLTRNLFPATKVRARIVRWNRLSSTSHLFDPNPRQDHDSLFKLPNALGRQDAHSITRS